MRRYLSILLLLLFVPVAFADLQVDDVRGYVNNDRVSDVDVNGGDFDAEPGDTLDLVVRLKNTENITVQAKLQAVIENIDNNADITKTQDFYDIGGNDDTSKTLSFTLPSGTRTDQYDMELKVYNGSSTVIRTINFNVIVDRTLRDNADINDILSNLTSSCNVIASTTNACFGYISTATNCSSELSTVKEERGTYRTQSEECSATKAELERQKVQLENQVANAISIVDCNNQTVMAVDAVKAKSSSNLTNIIMTAAAGWFLWSQMSKKKKAKSDVATSYENEYFNKV